MQCWGSSGRWGQEFRGSSVNPCLSPLLNSRECLADTGQQVVEIHSHVKKHIIIPLGNTLNSLTRDIVILHEVCSRVKDYSILLERIKRNKISFRQATLKSKLNENTSFPLIQKILDLDNVKGSYNPKFWNQRQLCRTRSITVSNL